ncbi:MAG: DNRLRE domain-containing protein [Rhizobacter sp.]|nr:DNRLRE domain-containing protein [Chlorobiales bacterium]
MTFSSRSLLLSNSVALFLLCLLAACGDERANVAGPNNGFYNSNTLAVFDSDSLATNPLGNAIITQQNYRFDSIRAFGNGRLPVGYVVVKDEDGVSIKGTLSTTAYVKFSSITYPFGDSTTTALEASLILQQQQVDSGSSSKGSGALPIEIRPVSQVWNSSIVTSTPLMTDAPVQPATLDLGDTASREIPLPFSIAEQIVNDARKYKGDAALSKTYFQDSSKGLAIAALAAAQSVIVNLNPSTGNTTTGVKLKLRFNRQTASGVQQETLNLDVYQYAYAINRTYESFVSTAAADSVSLFVQSGPSFRSRLQFDLSQIPRNAQIINAELFIYRDTTYSKIASGNDNIFVTYADAVDPLKFASPVLSQAATQDSAARYRTQNLFSGAERITAMVQRWIARPQDNHGFILTAGDEARTVEVWRFFGKSAPAGKRPRLVVTYLTGT